MVSPLGFLLKDTLQMLRISSVEIVTRINDFI